MFLGDFQALFWSPTETPRPLTPCPPFREAHSRPSLTSCPKPWGVLPAQRPPEGKVEQLGVDSEPLTAHTARQTAEQKHKQPWRMGVSPRMKRERISQRKGLERANELAFFPGSRAELRTKAEGSVAFSSPQELSLPSDTAALRRMGQKPGPFWPERTPKNLPHLSDLSQSST